MSNRSLFESWKGLSDHDLATELARETGKRLVIHREQEIEAGTTVWRLKDSGDMLAHNFLMEAFKALPAHVDAELQVCEETNGRLICILKLHCAPAFPSITK